MQTGTEIRIKGANIGCGRTVTEGWLNFDNSVSVRFARSKPLLRLLATIRRNDEVLKFGAAAREQGIVWANALKKIPVPDGSLDVVYSSHMLEHFDSAEAARFLLEVRRVLRTGGIVRLAVPDLRRRAEEYSRTGDADRFMASLCIGHTPHSLSGKIRTLMVGDRDNHKWMYDAQSLIRLLNRSGFGNARQMPPGETTIAEPGSLNLREREAESIYVEAVKA